MLDWLQHIDAQMFHFINDTLKNPVFDWLMPVITNKKNWYPFFALIYIWLLWKGGKKGRIAALLTIFVITLSDQISAGLLKSFFARPRPCIALDDVNMLSRMKTSFSFPSAHAANSFGAAFFFSYYYRKGAWVFLLLAFLVGYSRVYVGVHYPFDVLGGAVVGLFCAFVVIGAWNLGVRLYKRMFVKTFNPESSSNS